MMAFAMEYADITGETWAEIQYLAKRKQRHPDPEIAGAAYDWAADIQAESAGTWLSAGLMATVEGVLGGTGASAGGRLGEWWQARRLWRLGPPETTE